MSTRFKRSSWALRHSVDSFFRGPDAWQRVVKIVSMLIAKSTSPPGGAGVVVVVVDILDGRTSHLVCSLKTEAQTAAVATGAAHQGYHKCKPLRLFLKIGSGVILSLSDDASRRWSDFVTH